MFSAGLFITIAVVGTIDVNWAPSLNTLLLIILAIVTGRNARKGSRDRKQIKEQATAIEEKTDTAAKAALDIQQKITGSQRPPGIRTRKGDKL